MERVATLPGAYVGQHAEDEALIADGHINEGLISERLGIRGRPALAEATVVTRDLLLAELTGARYHVLHASCATISSSWPGRVRGVDVTVEVTPQHLSYTEEALSDGGALFKMNPPLRTAADQAALRCALADGAIDAIATDHAPHSDERKELPLDQAAPGMTGLETSLAAALTDVVEPGFASFETIIAAMTWQPARIAGLDQWGHGGPLKPGAPAISRSWMPARCGPWTRPGWRVGHPTTRTAVGNYAGESSIPSSAALRPGPPANGWSQLARSSRSLSIDPDESHSP